MHCVNALLDPISLPRMVTVEQRFDEDRLSNVAAAMRGELQRPAITDTVRPGMRIAVAVGSRGIHDMQTVVREIVSFLKAAGAHPFVIPAMGSHGGASAQGRRLSWLPTALRKRWWAARCGRRWMYKRSARLQTAVRC